MVVLRWGGVEKNGLGMSNKMQLAYICIWSSSVIIIDIDDDVDNNKYIGQAPKQSSVSLIIFYNPPQP